MATLAQFRTRISGTLGLTNESGHADRDLIDARVNAGVVDVLLQTGCRIEPEDLNFIAGEDDYNLNNSILLVRDAYIVGTSENSRLTRVTPAELIDMRIAGSGASSPPVTFYAMNGSNLLMVYPTPTSSSEKLFIYYVPRPTEMSDASHDPSTETYGGVPKEFHDAIEYYALWKLADFQDDETSAQGERYRSLYEQEIKKARKYVNMKGGVTLAPARVGRRRWRVPSDPSADVR